MRDLIGESIGNYKIIEKLGEGGMARVFRAYDTHLDRDVAIKFIRRDAISNEASSLILNRFEREAKALAKLSDLHIVKILDYGEHDNSPYLVMEYLPGGTLKELTGKPMLPSEAGRLLAPIAHALDYAHRQGVIHRDVKPANILITANGEPMLSDFGISKLLDMEDGHTLTGTNIGLGTPEYMAPEQWQNIIAPAVDIYSLGVVLFELVTGRKPYMADTPAAVLLKQAMDPLPLPRQFVSTLPDVVEKVIIKAIAKKPEERYISMVEFAFALEKLTPKTPTQHRAKLILPTLPKKPDLTSQQVTTYEHSTSYIDQPIIPQKNQKKLKSKGLMSLVGILVSVIMLAFLVGGVWQSGIMKIPPPTLMPSVNPTSQSVLESTVVPIATETATPILKSIKIDIILTTPEISPTPEGGLGIGSTQISPMDGMMLMYVPAGEFLMGSNNESDYEKPEHTVYLDAFWIDKTEVTKAMYSECVRLKKCDPPESVYCTIINQSQYPITCLNWKKAEKYCTWAGRDLPTEAQWEKAARGVDKRTYPWGENKGNSFGGSTLLSVGSNPDNASPYGVLDMVGSVTEWVADWYNRDYYKTSPKKNPRGSLSGTYRVLRGGVHSYGIDQITTTRRILHAQDTNDLRIGFRCAYNGESMSIVSTQIPSNDITLQTNEVPTAIPTTAIESSSPQTGGTGIGSTQISPMDNMTLMYVPAGEFQMGTNNVKKNDYEKPEHKVYLDAFWIGQTEVTYAMYSECVKLKRCDPSYCMMGGARKGYSTQPQNPVTCVTWAKANKYCSWVGGELPTEAQWEKAARGTDGRTYPWGEDASKFTFKGVIMPVGSDKNTGSPYGVLDMVGSVLEWTADWYNRDYYKNSPDRNPKGALYGEYRVLRGGGFFGNSDVSTTTGRSFHREDTDASSIGFRCVINE